MLGGVAVGPVPAESLSAGEGSSAVQTTLLAVNCGTPHVIGHRLGRPVYSAIGKSALGDSAVFFGHGGIAGDRQSNRFIHGGRDKAICAYAAGHWAWWRAEKQLDCTPGCFGENLTLLGPDEDSVCIADRFAWDEVILEVTAPRGPCANIDLHHGQAGLAQAITRSGRCGWYMRVVQEGFASTRMAILRHLRASGMPTVKEAFVARYNSRLPLSERVPELSRLSSNLRHALARTPS